MEERASTVRDKNACFFLLFKDHNCKKCRYNGKVPSEKKHVLLIMCCFMSPDKSKADGTKEKTERQSLANFF